jgi:hypothetical protein
VNPVRSLGTSLFVFAALTSIFPHSAIAASGTEGASFLDIPVGAGPAALGGAYAARATDAYGLIWNPAGLARMDHPELAGQHLSYLESIHYEFAGAAFPIREGTVIAAGAQYLGSGNVAGANNSGAPTGDFSNHYAAYSFAIGQALSNTFSFGLTGKWIEARLSDVHASAGAADVGALFQPTSAMSFSAGVMNLGSALTFINQHDPLPLSYRLGIAYNGFSHCTLSLDGVYDRTNMASAHTGFEWRPMSMVALRAGYRTDTLKELSALAGFSTGIGVRVLGQELSYAWVPMGDLGNTQYVSILLTLGSKSEREHNLVLNHDIRQPRIARSSATLRDDTDARKPPQDWEAATLLELLGTGDKVETARESLSGTAR